MKRKVLALTLASVLSVSCLAGCSTKDAGKENPSSAGSTSGGGEALSFSYALPNRYKVWLEDLNYWKDMQELSGVSVELVDSGESDDAYYQSMDLQVGSGDMPDAAIVRQSQASVYGAQGAFLDLKPLIEEKAPNVQKYIDEHPEYAELITSADGKIYGLGVENPLYTNLTFYRSDHFEKAGITQIPTTLEEFTEALRTLRDANASVQGYYPWVGRDGYLHYAECFLCNDSISEDGTVNGVYNGGNGYDIYADGFRDMVEWYHTLYEEKLIDPEWVMGTGTEEEWQTKFLTGQGSVSDDFFTRPTWFTSNGGPDNDPDFHIEVMDLFQTTDGDIAHRYFDYVNLDRYFVVSASCENTDAVMAFLDWLYSEEGQEVMHYGIDGVNTKKLEDGTHEWIADFAVESIKPVGEPNIGLYQDRLTFPYPVDNEAYYESLDSKVQSYCFDYFETYASYSKQLIYTEEQLEQRSNLLAKYETEFYAGVLAFVKGDEELNDENWEAFLEDMEAAGYSKINQIDQDAYDAMNA